MSEDDGEELEIPNFAADVVPLEGASPFQIAMLERLSILQKTVVWVHKKGNLGRRAFRLADETMARQKALEKDFSRLYWMLFGIGLTTTSALGIAVFKLMTK